MIRYIITLQLWSEFNILDWDPRI